MDRAPPIHPLTSLRFFAAIIVVFYHTYAMFLPSKPFPGFIDDLISVGFIGVSFFFVLSGFILAYNYLGPPDAAERTALTADWRSFFIARFARIYPLYLLGLLVHAPFVAAHRVHQDSSVPLALAKLLLSFGVNAGLVQAWLRSLWGGWNGPGWSLSAEAFFYAVFLFLAPILWRSRRKDATLLALLYGAALIVPSTVVILEGLGKLHWGSPEGLETFPLLRLPEFLFGVVLARIHLRARAREGSAGPVLLRSPAALRIMGALLLFAVILVGDRIPSLILHNGLLAPVFALVILGLCRGGGLIHRLLSRGSFVRLGEASYAVYILHVPLFFWFSYLVRDTARLHDEPALFGVDKPLYYVVYLATLTGLSVLSLRHLEDPARRWIRRLPSRARPSAALGAVNPSR